jgi:hypothetical protein
VLRPPHEEILSATARAIALASVVLLLAACARVVVPPGAMRPVSPPVPARNTAAVDDPAERVRFECAVIAQRLQGFDPGMSLAGGSFLGAVAGGATGGALGATFGLIGDVPGAAAATGATVLGAIGIVVGGLFKLEADIDAYERGHAACVAARAGQTPPVGGPPGTVEYRLRVLNLRHEAFTWFLSGAELADGASGPGLAQLAGVADAGDLGRGIVLYDRHVTPVTEPAARAFGATPVDARVKLASGRRDSWDEVRWYGKPGERTVWVTTARNRRPQEVRRLGLSDVAALAQFRPSTQPLFGAHPEATVSVGLSYLLHVQDHGEAAAYIDRALDRSRGIAAVVALSDDTVFPDRIYFIVNHAVSAATYEAVVAWGPRGEDRELPRER